MRLEEIRKLKRGDIFWMRCHGFHIIAEDYDPNKDHIEVIDFSDGEKELLPHSKLIESDCCEPDDKEHREKLKTLIEVIGERRE